MRPSARGPCCGWAGRTESGPPACLGLFPRGSKGRVAPRGTVPERRGSGSATLRDSGSRALFVVVQSRPTLCTPMDCSRPGFPGLHHPLELAQTHVHLNTDSDPGSPEYGNLSGRQRSSGVGPFVHRHSTDV